MTEAVIWPGGGTPAALENAIPGRRSAISSCELLDVFITLTRNREESVIATEHTQPMIADATRIRNVLDCA